MPPPSAFELQIIKQKDATLGLSLGQLAGGEPGVIVTKLTPTVANAPVKGKTLFKGSIIYSIATPQTGGEFVPAIRFRDVAALLRDAEGTITLKVGRAAVPEGWSERVDDNHETYYVHTEKHLMTSDHPAASFEQALKAATATCCIHVILSGASAAWVAARCVSHKAQAQLYNRSRRGGTLIGGRGGYCPPLSTLAR
eukprot:1038207-Prymnesium_polylepis.1